MPGKPKRYGMVIDLDRCIGCYSCQVSCKTEHDLSYGLFRCRLETVHSGFFPDNKKFFLPRLCHQCREAPCRKACPTGAIVKNKGGILTIHQESCNSCKECIEVCPYQAIYFDKETGKIDKCDFCFDRITEGLLPVCVESCMTGAIVFGDLYDDKSVISKTLKKSKLKQLIPGDTTHPAVFYAFTGNDPSNKFQWADAVKEDLAGLDNEIGSDNENGPPPARADGKQKFVRTSDAMCPCECGISVLVENGIAKRIYGNPHTLVNNGAICAKGAAGIQFTYSPYRTQTPLMRTGKRGEEKWEPVSWERACDYIAGQLISIKRRFGPESVVLDCGDVTDREAYYRLFHAFGTPNTYDHSCICDTNRRWGSWIMAGDERPLPDLQRPVLLRDSSGKLVHKTAHDAKLVLNIGRNPFVATRFNYMAKGIISARQENNCIYVVADPSFTNSAALADSWLPIMPGKDPEFLAALLYYLLKNDNPSDPGRRYLDHEFINRYTTGWDAFRDEFLRYAGQKDPSNSKNYFTRDWAEEKTGIPKAEIENIAHAFGITKPAAIEIGMHGTAHHTNGDVASILMTALCLITGNMDRPGGLVFIGTQHVKRGIQTRGLDFLNKIATRTVDRKSVSGRLEALQKDRNGQYPAAWKGVLADIPAKIRTGVKINFGPFKGHRYPLKALVIRAGNPVVTSGNTKDWTNAVTAQDPDGSYTVDLVVAIDTHINETGKHADIILPEAGFLERMGLSDVYTLSPEIALRDQVVAPLYESKTPFDIMLALAAALEKNGDSDIKASDFGKRYASEEDFINEILEDAPGHHNIGEPLPYPDLPEGAVLFGRPDHPTAVCNGKVIKRGKPLTVGWLRENHGVAIWPASYMRFKKKDGSLSDAYPNTSSGKFEFRFSCLERINKKFGTDHPTTFYWADRRWTPDGEAYSSIRSDFPYQLISGRAHHSGTMTQVCPHLGETETECMKPLNESFTEIISAQGTPGRQSHPYSEIIQHKGFKKDSFSIPTFSINHSDGEIAGLHTGDLITLENPLGMQIRGKVWLTHEIRPGVIKTVFGAGGRSGSGMGIIRKTRAYTPNINELVDPDNINPLTGMPGFGDIMVRIINPEKEVSE